MSYYNATALLLDWARKNLKKYLDPRSYPTLYEMVNAERRSKQLTRVELGMLKYFLEELRPVERTEEERRRYADSNAIKVPELAELFQCASTTIQRSKSRINTITKRDNGVGLFVFHDMGICINPTLWDAIRARAYSELQGASQLDAHADNIEISDAEKAKRTRETHRQDRLAQFRALSPEEQARIIEKGMM